jgi:recombination protein RecA
MDVSVISIGSFDLGAGGLPRGNMCEIFGLESSEKITFCLSLIAEAQQGGENAIFNDVKHVLD